MASDPVGIPRKEVHASGLRRLIAMLLAIAATSPGASVAQDPDAPPTAQKITVLDFANMQDRMTVPVSIGSNGPYHFVVDTGAQRTVISRELASRLNLVPGKNIRLTAMTGSADVGTVVIPMLSVSTIAGSSIEAPSLESRNLGAPGMLGLDTLQGHALTIDFIKHVMTLSPSTRRKRSLAPRHGEVVVRGKDLYGELIVADAKYRGRKVKVILDTGSGLTMGNMALQRLVARTSRLVRPISLWGVTGQAMVANYTQIDKVDFAGITFSHLPVAFSDAEPFRHFGLLDEPALLLGMDSLRLFEKVKIDFPNREVRLMVTANRAATAGVSPLDSIPLGR